MHVREKRGLVQFSRQPVELKMGQKKKTGEKKDKPFWKKNNEQNTFVEKKHFSVGEQTPEAQH